MKNVLLIVVTKIRREISQITSLFAFVFVAGLLLNLGLLLLICFDGFFDERSQAVNAPHFVLGEETRLYDEEHLRYLVDYPGVTATETETGSFGYTKLPFNDSTIPGYTIFLNAANTRTMNNLNLFEGTAPTKESDICLPYVFKSGGHNIGDEITINVHETDYTFVISGFTEEIMYGSVYNQFYQVYLSDAGYSSFSSDLNAEYTFIRAQLENPEKSSVLNQDFIKEFFSSEGVEGEEVSAAGMITMPWTQAKLACTYMSNITSIVLVMFAALVVIITLIVIRFRIQNSIEENMTNIGSLKAVGLTSLQLKMASVLRFGGVALFAVLAGAWASYAVLPVVIDVLEQQTTLRWQQGFDPLCYFLTVCSIMVAILVVTLFSLRKIGKLHPLAALRTGLSARKFKKKQLPLDRTVGPLTWLLALKNILQSRAQHIIIFIIVASLSFASVAGLSIYDNLGRRSDSFVKLLLGEVPDAKFFTTTPENAEALYDQMADMITPRKLFYCQEQQLKIDDKRSGVIITDSFDVFEGVLFYDGRPPTTDTEICISGTLAELSGRSVGDIVVATKDGNSQEYTVVGLIQTIANNGISSTLTTDGYMRLQPDFRFVQIYVYLHDPDQTSQFVDSVNDQNSERIAISQNMKMELDAQSENYSRIFFWIAVALVIVTVLMVFLVLYLMLKTVMLRRWREMGIQKAIGFTTIQLMNQLVLYFLPTVALGVICGSILGVLGFNQLFVLFAQSMGIMNASMPAPITQTVIVCFAMIALAYMFIMLLSLKIRKISAYALITE